MDFSLICWKCEKEHDSKNYQVDQVNARCTCGGYVITPSGKIILKRVDQ